jgi:hypothetical protein
LFNFILSARGVRSQHAPERRARAGGRVAGGPAPPAGAEPSTTGGGGGARRPAIDRQPPNAARIRAVAVAAVRCQLSLPPLRDPFRGRPQGTNTVTAIGR